MTTNPKRISWRDLAKKSIVVVPRGARNTYGNSVLAIVDMTWPRSYDTPNGAFFTTTIAARPIGTMPPEPLKCTVQKAAKELVEEADPPFPMEVELRADEPQLFKITGQMLSLPSGTLIEMSNIHVNYSYGKKDGMVHANIEVGTVTPQPCMQPDGILHHVLTDGGKAPTFLKLETDLDGMSEIPKAEKYGKRSYVLQHNPYLTAKDKDKLSLCPSGYISDVQLNSKSDEMFVRTIQNKTTITLQTTAQIAQWKNGGSGGYDDAPDADCQIFSVSLLMWPEQLRVLRINNPEAWKGVAPWVLQNTPFSILFCENRQDTRDMPFYTEPDNDAVHPLGITDVMAAQINALAIDVPRAYLRLGIPLTFGLLEGLMAHQGVNNKANPWHPRIGGEGTAPANVMDQDVINLTEYKGELSVFSKAYTFVALPHLRLGDTRVARAYVRADKASLTPMLSSGFMDRYRNAMSIHDFDDKDAEKAFATAEGIGENAMDIFSVLRALDGELPTFSVFAILNINTRYKKTVGSKALGKILDSIIPDPARATAAMVASFEEQATILGVTLQTGNKRERGSDNSGGAAVTKRAKTTHSPGSDANDSIEDVA